MRPLSDLRVITFTHGAAGPYAGRLLREWGAEVLKVESPDGSIERNSLLHDHYLGNRGTDNLAIDLKTEEGTEIIHELVAEEYDILIENFRPGVMEEFGLDYETLSDLNDELIYCSLSGFGHSGPYKDRPALDPIVQAMSGLMEMTGEPDRTPSRIGASVLDLGTATNACFAIMVAVHQRQRIDEGQFIDTSLFDTAFGWAGIWAIYYTLYGSVPERKGDKIEMYAPVGLYETQDDLVYISALGDSLWQKFCTALDLEELTTDPRFEEADARIENREELDEIVEERTTRFDAEELVDHLLAFDVPAAKLMSVPETLEDEHLQARDMLVEVETEDHGDVVAPGVPMKLEKADPANPKRTPKLGEDSVDVLEAAGYSDGEIETLLERGVVVSDE